MAEGDFWVSAVLNETRYVVGTDRDSEEPAWKSIAQRELPAAEDLPARLYAVERDVKFEKRLPDLFTGRGGTKISSKLAEVFRPFNLGLGWMCPAKLYLYDRLTPTNHEFFLIMWEARQLLDVENSVGLRGYSVTRHQPDPPPPDVWGMPWELNNGDIAITPRGLNGLDLWYDPKLRGGLFFSDRLCRALRDAGYSDLFKFRRCSVSFVQ